MRDQESTEALIVGAGPAGLTAAIYLARFHRRVAIFDTGRSRARLIPVSHNCPGFTHGVSGPDFLERLRGQAGEHGVRVRDGEIRELRRDGDRFVAITDQDRIVADRVILASGVIDVLPAVAGVHDAICRGVIRLCAICDAYETRGKRIGVYGHAETVGSHVRYLRSFCADVTPLREDAVRSLTIEEDRVLARMDQGVLEFDAIYPVLGVRPNSGLATALGAQCDDDGYLRVDAHLRTTVPGLFAIGDVAHAINQIAVATGHAAIAATTVHNELPHKQI